MVKSNYPTLEQVEKASLEQLAYWMRYLPSPGSSAIGENHREVFEGMLQAETIVLEAIATRFKELGGWTPELSKKIGWSS